jgi:hypothetical protein
MVLEANEDEQGAEEDSLELDKVVFWTSRQVVVVVFPGRTVAV